MLGLDESAPIELRDRRAWASDGRSVSLADLALHVLHAEDQEQIMGTASYLARESPSPFAAQAAEVEVDVDTGQVTVGKLVTAVDCGVPINPLTASGQVEGGVMMALGYALCEELVLDDDGRPVNARLGAYWIYRADDAPATEVFLVQTNEPSGPFGAKAVGEIPTVGVAPAVRNAILDATGVGPHRHAVHPRARVAGPARSRRRAAAMTRRRQRQERDTARAGDLRALFPGSRAEEASLRQQSSQRADFPRGRARLCCATGHGGAVGQSGWRRAGAPAEP